MTNPDQHPSLVDGDQVDSLSRDHAHTHNAAREADASSLVNSAASPARERWHDAHCSADPSLPLWRPGSGCSCRKDCWRDIESAPRDGTRYLAVGADFDGVAVVAYGKTSHVPLYGFCMADQGAEDFDLCSPTRWMPFPDPPPENGLGDRAGHGTVSTKADSGTDPEKAALRERVRGLEEALRPFAVAATHIRPDDADTMRPAIVQAVHYRKAQAALLPLPEGGIGKAAQSQPSRDEGPTASLPLTQHSDGGGEQ